MAEKTPPLKAPFPYFGGKSQVADLVWERLGNPDNYVEPFAGSAAILLKRPAPGKTETINDRNHFLVNFWRAVARDPKGVALHADWPVSEADLHARHRYLMRGPETENFRERVAADPEYFDTRFAGWWVWGQCCWIGNGWCVGEQPRHGDGTDQAVRPTLKDQSIISTKRPMTTCGNSQFLPGVHGEAIARGPESIQMPHIDRGGRGVHQVPNLSGDGGAHGRGVVASAGHKKMPLLNNHNSGHGTGIHGNQRPIITAERATHGAVSMGREGGGRPQLGDVYDIGRGVCSNRYAGTCDERRAWLTDWMQRLSDRTRLVRVCYGSWDRICSSDTTMVRLGTCGAAIDPPYAKDCDRLQAWIKHLMDDGPEPDTAGKSTNRDESLYAGDTDQDIDRLVADVHMWCRKWGVDPRVRIALFGYQGEHDSLEALGWGVVAWKAHGGYGNRNKENENKHRERIWFSPGCVPAVKVKTLFGDEE